METTLKAFIESLKPDFKLLLSSFAILYIGFLFLPADLEPIKLLQAYKVWIHLIGLISTAYLICLAVSRLIPLIKFRLDMSFKKKYLKTLARDEKVILRKFIIKEQKTVNLSLSDGSVHHLVNLGFLYRSSTVGDARMNFDFTIQPWAWTYLNSNKHFLGKNTDFPEENPAPPTYRF